MKSESESNNINNIIYFLTDGDSCLDKLKEKEIFLANPFFFWVEKEEGLYFLHMHETYLHMYVYVYDWTYFHFIFGSFCFVFFH